MCGISGLFYFDPARRADAADLARMRSVTRHRGPDDHGELLDGPAGLAFNRLSIIDLAGGHQPMSSEDGSAWLIFNGEIYNFRQLREELEGRGHRFRTRSDSEVILHSWEEYGPECVSKLRGMFAFAIWDARRRMLFGARDRLGIKPFYYHANTERFAFASEMKALLELEDVPREVAAEALGEFLRRRYVIAPDTLLREVKKLPPAHVVEATAQGVRIRRYWDAPFGETREIGEAAALEETGALLEEVVRMHLVADVPLGAFLSGGVDSSCVVALMARLGVPRIKTFSIGYDSAESELDYARLVATRFATDHHELRLTPMGFREALPKIVWHMDEPVGDPAALPLFHLAEFARREVTVALSGEGSDEIFAGYPIYARMLGFEKANRVPLARLAGRALAAAAGDTKVRKYADMLGRPLEWRYGGVGGLFSEQQAARLNPLQDLAADHVARTYERCRALPPLARMSYLDLTTWLPDDLLVKADRMTMGNSLELRVPFLDHVLVEFAARLPERLKVRGGVTKYLLKKLAEPLLPREIIYRPKQGFPVPIKGWFRGDLAGFARETLFAENGAVREFLSAPEIERLLAAHRMEDRSEQIYSLLVLQEWHRRFVQAGQAQTALP